MLIGEFYRKIYEGIFGVPWSRNLRALEVLLYSVPCSNVCYDIYALLLNLNSDPGLDLSPDIWYHPCLNLILDLIPK